METDEGKECGHVSAEGVVCTREPGHEGNHSRYDLVSEDEGSSHFVVHEWNDKGEHLRLKEFGTEFPCRWDASDAEKEEVVRLAILDAKKTLAQECVFEIRGKPIPRDGSTDYGRTKIFKEQQVKDWGIAWYYVEPNPEGFERFDLPTEPLFDFDPSNITEDPAKGYCLLARMKT